MRVSSLSRKLAARHKPTWRIPQACLLLLLLGSLSLCQTSLFSEAKTHHSKRQAPSYAQTGRESTNWWNLWWQQYINEAAQPTVRPIVGVSFNGRSINLQEQDDVETNFVPSSQMGSSEILATNTSGPTSQDLSMANNIDFERNGRLRYVSELPNDGAGKQMEQHKSFSQQANWQAVRPTIIQMPRDSRAARRQADVYTIEELAEQREDLGIQMRVPMIRAKDTGRRTQQAVEEPQFEQQQQNQMVDYGEEGEPDVVESPEGGSSAGSGMLDQERRTKPTVDSSSSNMMMPSVNQGQQSRPGDTSTRMPPPPVMMVTIAKDSQPSKPTSESARTTTGAPLEVSTEARESPNSAGSESTQSASTSTVAPGTSIGEIDLSETPISIEPANRPRTTLGGRVELMNGRPAPGMKQQMPSTNSVRLPTSTMSSKSVTAGGEFVTSTTNSPLGARTDQQSSTTQSSSGTTGSATSSPTTTSTIASGASDQTLTGDRGSTTSASAVQSTSAPTGESTTSESTTSDTTDDTDDSEDQEGDQTDRPTLNSAGNDANSGDDDDEGEEEEGDQTSTIVPSSESTETSKQPATTTTTTTPSANIEIERLPKVDSTDQQSPMSSGSGQKTNANLVMTNLADQQPTLTDQSTGISVPMDVLMRMIMMNQMVEEDQRRATSTTTRPVSSQVEDGRTKQNVASTPADERSEGQESRQRPQPPPTTTTTTTTTTRTPTSTTPAPSQPRFMTIRVESPGSMSSSGEETEPKVELLNLDLMPIQRIMTAQDRQTMKSQQQPQSKQPSSRPQQSQAQPEVSIQQPSGGQISMSPNPSGPVEPGMRLRPVTAPPQTVSTKQPVSMSSMMNVKMIGKQPSGAHTKRPGIETSSAPRGPSTSVSFTTIPATDSPSSTPSSTRISTTTSTTTTTFTPSSSTTSTTTPSSSSTRISITTSSTKSNTPELSSATGSSSSSQTQPPNSSTLSTLTSDTPTSTQAPSASTVGQQSNSSLGTTKQTKSDQAEASTTSRPPPLPMSTQSGAASPSGSNTSATSTAVSQISPATSSPSSSKPKEVKLERIQQQPAARPGTKAGLTKVNPSKQAGNSTASSSFIPGKLRSDFSKIGTSDRSNQTGPARVGSQNRSSIGVSTNSDLVTTSTPTPQQAGMAIRQFGGANRMSVLANQPVPFGRPAAMQSRTQRFELPTFEYGPAIAVRRPDEPLANGQMPNCTLTGKNFCVLTKDYPMNEVRQAVERSFRSVRIMYEELQTVSDQELHKEDFLNATSSQAASGKFACQTQVEMMRPGWAKDEITKEWMLVVNTDVFPQRVRTESCAQPNTPCEFIAPFYDSTCQQRYSLHRMIAIDPHDPSRSPQVAVFKFPAGCVCRVHPIRKTTTSMIIQTTLSAQQTTPIPATIISSSTSRSIRRRRR